MNIQQEFDLLAEDMSKALGVADPEAAVILKFLGDAIALFSGAMNAADVMHEIDDADALADHAEFLKFPKG